MKLALSMASMVVFVCESQRQLYKPKAPSSVIFVGVPDPLPRQIEGSYEPVIDTAPPLPIGRKDTKDGVFTFLCLGIVCPRKNQKWTVEVFREWAQDRTDVRLKVVGARYTRAYEIEYLEQVRSIVQQKSPLCLSGVSDLL